MLYFVIFYGETVCCVHHPESVKQNCMQKRLTFRVAETGFYAVVELRALLASNVIIVYLQGKSLT